MRSSRHSQHFLSPLSGSVLLYLQSSCMSTYRNIKVNTFIDYRKYMTSRVKIPPVFVRLIYVSYSAAAPPPFHSFTYSLTPAVTLSQKLHLLWSGLDLVIFAGTFFFSPWFSIDSVRLEEEGWGWKWMMFLFIFTEKMNRGRNKTVICVRRHSSERREGIAYPPHSHTP